MTSKTSYFEPALFLRGLKKTFPVWLAYVVLWILFLPLSILNRAQWDPKAADIRELILSGAIASVNSTRTSIGSASISTALAPSSAAAWVSASTMAIVSSR